MFPNTGRGDGGKARGATPRPKLGRMRHNAWIMQAIKDYSTYLLVVVGVKACHA